ncbi:MAG TPA: TrmH family RNA methyltransferase [Fibrobacteria bacterium]|nr:TrmH family RNA methyltransferase [Fibrobacteria bacterium]
MGTKQNGAGGHPGDNDDDFDLSGFADGSAAAGSGAEAEGRAGKPAEPPRGKKIVGKPPRSDAFKTAPRRPAPAAPDKDAPREAGGKGPFPDRKGTGAGPRGPGGQGTRGGWEKLPQREHFRGRDQGFVPRGPRNAGPRDTGARNAGAAGKFNDRGDARGPREFPGAGAPRGYVPRPGGPGAPSPRAMRTVERAGGDHKPVSPEIRPFLPLKTDKGRWKESQFLLEGAKNIADALSVSTGIIQTVFLAEGFDDKDLLAVIKKHRIETIPISMDDLRNLCDTETPQSVLAVANFATLRPDWNTARYVTILDAVQDPGNVGAILRTSLALGMDAVVMGKGTCDPYNPKVVRSSVGALLRLPFETGEDIGGKMDFLRQKGFSIVATSSHAPITLDKAKLRKKVALIMGNEGAGTGATYLDMADAVVKIPLKNKVESLNVSVAHGILSYQLIHGRT